MISLFLIGCTPAPEPAPIDPAAVARGWDVLRYGGFVGSGIPADLWFDLGPAPGTNVLDREGRSAQVERSYNLFAAPNGVEVVGGLTCFGCHGAEIDGTFYPGIGDPRLDFTSTGARLTELAELAVSTTYGPDSPEAEASAPFFRGASAVLEFAKTPFAGVNPAFSLERAAVAHRDPETLAWEETPRYTIPEVPIWSDTPPWWHLKKRQTLYWTGFGTGDPERLLMQIGTVALTDLHQAEATLEEFDDVVAWIRALEPPAYPGVVDEPLAQAGEGVFEKSCARCHGTYGSRPTYPESVVPLAEVGTDPTYARAFDDTPFVQWLEGSWFASGSAAPTGELGYVAPPLDGIWATAPYLHNGSVPDLVSLIDPTQRPPQWRRDPSDTSLDHDRMGWPYTVPPEPDSWTFDTSIEAAGNQGHTFAAALSAKDQRALLEYLKTL